MLIKQHSIALAITLALTACGGESQTHIADSQDLTLLPEQPAEQPNQSVPAPATEPTPEIVEDNHDFFAYYTHSNNSNSPPNSHPFASKYGDVVVNLQNKGQLVFSAASNFLPQWHHTDGIQSFEHLAPSLKETVGRFDPNNDFAYVRIIEQNPEQIVIHWRYMKEPALNNHLQGLSQAIVHELFTITANGEVTRLHRPGTDTITQWQALNGAIEQTLNLTADGLDNIQTLPAQARVSMPSIATNLVVATSPVIDSSEIGKPIAKWRFDEGQGQTANDDLSNMASKIVSHGNDWVAGVSGNALQFDGYRSALNIPQQHAPAIGAQFAIEAWLYLDAYPWNNAPIVQQVSQQNFQHNSQQKSETQATQGFNFGVTGFGKLNFSLANSSVSSNQTLPLRQWLHVSASVNDSDSVNDNITLYINGETVAQTSAPNNLDANQLALLVGLNNQPNAAIEGVRFDDLDEFHHFSSLFGLESMLDELTIHGRALTADEIQASYQQHATSLANVETPSPRALPDLEQYPQQFGAYHTRLPFHDMWDNMWRVTQYEDIVVRFDDEPISLVYWRGTSHGMNLVTEDYWMSDQSVEMIIPDMEDEEEPANQEYNPIVTLAEHMSDKSALRTHVRVIENSPARVKIHWRYATADVFGTKLQDNAFVDEIHTIYPDGVAIRDVFFHAAENLDSLERPGTVFYQDFQWLIGPGQNPQDFMNATAVSLAKLDGGQTDILYPYNYQTDSEGQSIPEPGNIAVLNSKTEWKVFGISQGSSFYPADNGESSKHIDFNGQDFPFAGPWNHWPVAQIPSDGRFAIAHDRVSHFALGVLEAFKYGTGAMMYGFVQSDAQSLGDATALQGLGKSWVTPPTTSNSQGVKNNRVVYNKNERAFDLTATDNTTDISLDINASEAHPLSNPAFVVRQWNSNKLPQVLVNNQAITDSSIGIVRDSDGSQMLVVFVPIEHTSTTKLTLKPRNRS